MLSWNLSLLSVLFSRYTNLFYRRPNYSKIEEFGIKTQSFSTVSGIVSLDQCSCHVTALWSSPHLMVTKDVIEACSPIRLLNPRPGYLTGKSWNSKHSTLSRHRHRLNARLIAVASFHVSVYNFDLLIIKLGAYIKHIGIVNIIQITLVELSLAVNQY